MAEIKEFEILKDYKDVLTFKELQTAIRKGRNKTYDLLRDGTIPSIKIGRDYRILKADVIDFIYNHQALNCKSNKIKKEGIKNG